MIPFGNFTPGRDVRVKVGSFTWSTAAAGNTIAVTGLGFQPKAVIFWTGRASTVDQVAGSSASRTYGCAVSSSSRMCVTNAQSDAAGTSVTFRKFSQDAICQIQDAASGAVNSQLDFQSMDADGFTVIVDTALSTARSVGYLAFGGQDLTDAAIGTLTEPGATGTLDVTTPGFSPDLVMFIHNSTTSVASTNDATTILGAMNGVEQFTGGGKEPNGQAVTANVAYLRYDSVISDLPNGGTAIQSVAAFSSWLSNGFRLNYSERNSNRLVGHLSMKGIKSKIGTMSTRTDGANIVVTGLGFQPKAVLFYSLGIAESVIDTVTASWEHWSLGAASGPADRFTEITRSQTAVTTTNVANAVEHDEVYGEIDGGTDTIAALMDLVSLDNDGFTCIMDDVAPSAKNVTYIAFG